MPRYDRCMEQHVQEAHGGWAHPTQQQAGGTAGRGSDWEAIAGIAQGCMYGNTCCNDALLRHASWQPPGLGRGEPGVPRYYRCLRKLPGKQ